MLTVFASTAGITGSEVAIAGGSAVVGQKLLETVFGEETVRRMATEARNDLNQRLDGLLRTERERYYSLTDPLLEGTPAETIHNAANAARRAVAERFPGTLAAPALSAPQPKAISQNVEASFDHGPLRGLLDQLRGTFSRPNTGETTTGEANGTV